MSEKKVVRSIAVMLGIICVILVVSLVGAFTYFVPMVNDKNDTVSSLNSQVTNLQDQINDLNATFNSYMNTHSHSDSEYNSLSNQNTNLQNQIASLNSTISSLSSQVTNLQNQTTSINSTINSLSSQVAELQNQVISQISQLEQYINATLTGKAIQIQSIIYTGTHLVVYVQNVGQSSVTFTPNQCLYIDGLLRNNASVNIDISVYVSANRGTLEQTKTASIIDNVALSLNQKVKLKVVTNEGTWIEAYFTVSTFTG